MKLTKRQMIVAQQALGYAVMFAKTEGETAEFALLKFDVETALIKENEAEEKQREHEKKGCPFQYCDSNPPCEGKCRYAESV